jgi:hypothetical protein
MCCRFFKLKGLMTSLLNNLLKIISRIEILACQKIRLQLLYGKTQETSGNLQEKHLIYDPETFEDPLASDNTPPL